MIRQQLWGLMLLAAVAAYLWGSGEPKHLESSRSTGPNVLLITLDTTRADAISAEQTPWVMRMADEGAQFSLAVSTAPITQPAHLGILSGEPPIRSGVVTNGTHIGDRPGMLSHRLKAGGWVTAAFVSATPLTKRFGWDQGWDHFGDNLSEGIFGSSRERSSRQTVDEALDWLAVHKGERFGVWLHLFDPHGPYEAPGAGVDGPTDGPRLDLPGYWPEAHLRITDPAWFVTAYGAEVAEVDRQLGRVISRLEQWGILDDTVVVITADHGESLTEHDYLFDHGDHLYDVSLRVPLVLRWPGHIQAGLKADCLTPTTYILPTLVELLGLGAPKRSLASVLDGSEPCVAIPVLASTVSERFADPPPIDHAYRTDDLKRVVAASGKVQCFDLVSDAAELAPTSECPGDIAATMDALLATGAAATRPQTDRVTEEQLRGLGYIE
jgi:arylsulfatase A-like enzyme